MMTLMLKILAVVGWLLLAILLLVVWVILVPRHFWLEYCKAEGVTVKMNIGPFKLNLVPPPKFLNKKSDGKKEQKPQTEQASSQTAPQQSEKPNPFGDLQLSMELVKDVVNSAKGVMKRIFKAIKFRDVSFTAPVYAGDVYKTQKLYGIVTNSFYTLATFLQQHLQITFKSPLFVADFANRHSESVYFYTQITASPVLLLSAGWFAYNQYNLILENNKKAPQAMEKENNNG